VNGESEMSESRPLASLSSALLARKGQAKPAMRPQALQSAHNYSQSLEDLGWNDMGDDSDSVHETGIHETIAFPGVDSPHQDEPPVVVEQQESLAREYSQPEQLPESSGYASLGLSPIVQPPKQQAVCAPRAAAGSKGKAAFTLRLDSDRHLQLRLVCAVKHKSAQQIVTQALDNYLARQPEVADLMAKARN
jgi:hypothetical protein